MKNKIFKSTICFFLILIISNNITLAISTHRNENQIEKDGSILLPIQKNPALSNLINAENSTKANLWKEFFKKNGDWAVMLDRFTNTPIRAIGNAVKLKGFDRITESNVEAACLSFLKENSATFNIDVSQLRFVRKDFAGKRWYVSYKQYYNGIEVLLSEIELRIFENGNVMAFGIDFYNDIDITMKPIISYSEAQDFATAGIKGKAQADILQSADKVYILPVKSKNSVSYKLVYKVNVLSSEKIANFTTYVDAYNGEVVWRFNKLNKSISSFDIKGGVKIYTPTDTVSIENFPYQAISIGSNTFTSDKNGRINVDIPDSSFISANLAGTYGRVLCKGRDSAYFKCKFINGEPFSLQWNDSNSHRYERNMYYHLNCIHDFMKNLDTQLRCIDIPFTILLYFMPDPFFGDSPNAYSNGDSIVFLGCHNTSMLMADGPSVLYHEYGHSVNNLFYLSKGRLDGMINASCHEGSADFTAAMILDEPKVGVGVFTNDATMFIRNAENNLIYPDSILPGDSHHNGQILSGSYWDLRNSTDLTTASNLMHYARYGLPDDPDDGRTFYKWFIETIIADDDDGDLSNGTPNMVEIFRAFNNHQIGTNLHLMLNFQHKPINDTRDTINPYMVEFTFGEKSFFSQPDSVMLTFQVKQPNKEITSPIFVKAELQTDGKTYKASIPAQQTGSELIYYINVYDKYSENPLKLSSSPITFIPFNFLVGFRTALLDNFEKEGNWIIGNPNEDDATIGKWERGKPNLFDWNGFLSANPIKPANDHTLMGDKCYITGLAIPDETEEITYEVLSMYFTNGTTTLTSPKYDLSKLENVYLRFYVFFRQQLLMDIGIKPALITEISNDGGLNWTRMKYDSTDGKPDWEKIQIRFEEYLKPTNECMIRFRFKEMIFNFFGVNVPLSIGSAAIDDFEILTMNDNNVIMSTEDKNVIHNSLECYPNPISREATIYFVCQNEGFAVLSVYDELGNKVLTLLKNYIEKGTHNIFWDTYGMPAGAYLLELKTGITKQTKAIVINK